MQPFRLNPMERILACLLHITLVERKAEWGCKIFIPERGNQRPRGLVCPHLAPSKPLISRRPAQPITHLSHFPWSWDPGQVSLTPSALLGTAADFGQILPRMYLQRVSQEAQKLGGAVELRARTLQKWLLLSSLGKRR